MSLPDEALLHAARLSLLPGRTMADVCRLTGVSRRALAAARKSPALAGFPTLRDLVLATLTESGTKTEGEIPADLSGIAAFIDWQNHDGCTASEVKRLLGDLARDGIILLEGGRWRLLRPWP